VASQEYVQLIEDCEHDQSKLTDWELGFLDNIRCLLERGLEFSDKQASTLESIWERVTRESYRIS
jgi:Fic family protein